ncbi:uncharacterized protein EV420DRAFT_1576461 [Desarmillaria tabescens]|uniref:Uncharacterized protein n=1 Tax=Armillaria tabescens TaxID=1929756 RepID=A0AA39JMX9_ARMTA|nr:uncharacterized protein EV420DRAFT_1576461 [Desarmillaria tabescens]KAK0443353.1 hypothetical protein EV420DRAFT_1576461 [Desarmillaria tabescens]
MPNVTQESMIPQPIRIPRHRLQGGFLISPETALEWASRLENRPVTEILVAWRTIVLRVSRTGARLSMVGVLYSQFMVVTQQKTFRRGYLGMDPSEIPQFREGALEAIVRKMLKEDSIHDPVFATTLDY